MLEGFPGEELMQQFSDAYMRAIASAAGFAVNRQEVDYDSVDLRIEARGYVNYNGKRGNKRSPHLGVQLKCTYAHQYDGKKLSYRLPIKNHEELRQEDNALPRILVVVCVPEMREERLVWSPEDLRLLRCAYWRSLRGEPESTNKGNKVTVRLSEPLSPKELRRLMYLVAQEELR